MYILLIKKTVTNIFCIVINNKGKLICYVTCGMLNYRSGQIKRSNYVFEQVGNKLGLKLFDKKIYKIDYFILQTKLDFRIRSCLKGLMKKVLQIKKIIILPNYTISNYIKIFKKVSKGI